MPILIPKTNYSTSAVVFDGTNDYMTRGSDLTGNTDGKKGIVSFWIYLNGVTGYIFTSANAQFQLKVASSILTLAGVTTSAASTLIMNSNTAVSSSVWHHVAMSWDLSAGLGKLYIDGSSNLATSPTLLNNNIDYTATNYYFGARDDGASRLNAYVADFYLNLAEYLDISVAANLQKFRSTLGKPVNLGSTGSLPTGTAPIQLFRCANGASASTFSTNLGTGGNYSITGALTVAPSSPSD